MLKNMQGIKNEVSIRIIFNYGGIIAMKEAAIALCKCKESHKVYGVRFEKVSSKRWKYTWAFKIKESSAQREGYDGTEIDGTIEPASDYPGCPYCGSKYFVICQCGKLNCNTSDGKTFKCEWCGLEGTLASYGGDGIKSGQDI